MERLKVYLSYAALVVPLLAAGCSGCTSAGQKAAGYRNPVASLGFADPSVIRADDGTYWAYATNTGGYAVPMMKSSDLIAWQFSGSALPNKPSWHPATFRAELWAPHIARIGGNYLLYYSLAVWGEETGELAPGIGVAVSDTPEGPFEDRGKLFLSDEIGVRNSIDPFVMDDGGTVYLFWGSWGGIWGMELSPDGLSVRPGSEKFQIGGSAYEAAWIEKIDGRYYFLGSMGSCCEGKQSTYKVVVARSDSIRGPYTGPGGMGLLLNGAGILLEGNGDVAGPGHISIARDDAGGLWMLYHAWSPANTYRERQLFVDPVVMGKDGWPEVPGGGYPSYPGREGRSPSVKK